MLMDEKQKYILFEMKNVKFTEIESCVWGEKQSYRRMAETLKRLENYGKYSEYFTHITSKS
jgi:hypothetical protein